MSIFGLFKGKSKEPSLFEKREAIALQASSYVVKALEEFARTKWNGTKFQVYYKNNIELNTDGRFEWLVVSEQGTPVKSGSKDSKYPTYYVILDFDYEANPVGFRVKGGTTSTVDTEKISEQPFSEEALKLAITELFTNDYPPGNEFSWRFQEKGTKRLK